MTLPRQVVPGRDYMITRRCSERRFFLRPDEKSPSEGTFRNPPPEIPLRGYFPSNPPRGYFPSQLSAAVSENPCMTLPRQVVPGRDYMITRRCSERRFFLRPDEDTNNAFIYCLALAARRAKVEVTFSVALSNHHHTGIHDPDGNFPVFIEHFHGLLARCQNAYLGRYEGFWSSEPTSVVHLVEPNDILDKMTYAFTNPTAADSGRHRRGMAWRRHVPGHHFGRPTRRDAAEAFLSRRRRLARNRQPTHRAATGLSAPRSARMGQPRYRKRSRRGSRPSPAAAGRQGHHRARTGPNPRAESFSLSTEPCTTISDEPARGREEQVGAYRGAPAQPRLH